MYVKLVKKTEKSIHTLTVLVILLTSPILKVPVNHVTILVQNVMNHLLKIVLSAQKEEQCLMAHVYVMMEPMMMDLTHLVYLVLGTVRLAQMELIVTFVE
jgi:hypothetical protein